MKVTLVITEPVLKDEVLKTGNIYHQTWNGFKALLIELGKYRIVGQDTDGSWEWKDFFHHLQYPGGVNGSDVREVKVLNTNNGCDRITLALTYHNNTFTTVILHMPNT